MSWTELELDTGWTLDGPEVEGLPARVPGTVAGALRDAGRGIPDDLDEHPWTFACTFASPAAASPVVLRLSGLATLARVELGGEELLASASMWQDHAVEVTDRLAPPGEPNRLVLHFTPLGPELRQTRRPRARWRTRLVAGGLRWQRTMLLGRMPGIAPSPPAIGPWRPVVLELRGGAGIAELTLRARLEGNEGVLVAAARVVGADATDVAVELDGPSGRRTCPLAADGTAELRIAEVARWWPHTHGLPVLHDVRLVHDGEVLAERRVGFRALAPGGRAGHDVERDGLDLHLNGVGVWIRGAVWTPPDPVGLAVGPDVLRAQLERVRGAGMNMVRVVGTAHYEPEAFHALCDELGVLVWQDLMLANLDYPLADDGFRTILEAEIGRVVETATAHPSTVVVCGGSEVSQQAAMAGAPLALARETAGHTLLPAAVAAAGCDVVVVADAPTGGGLPFRNGVGVANYFGVGGYRRSLADVRGAGVRFASECLAFANLGDGVTADAGAGPPRDAGADWDFADVRDHYLRELYAIDPAALRSEHPLRYDALSRAITGEVMAEVMGEWRRPGSACGGGLVLWLRDLVPGAGWGLLDHAGEPKACWWHLRRALAPVAVWTTDEGLDGIAVHLANDGPDPLSGTLRITLRQGERLVEEGERSVSVAAHSAVSFDAEEVLGRFLDVSLAYGFGPPAHDLVVATFQTDGGLRRQAVRFPAGRPLTPRSAGELGASASLRRGADGRPHLAIETERLLYGVRVELPGFLPSDDAFHVVPGVPCELDLTAQPGAPAVASGRLTALNLEKPLTLRQIDERP